MRTITSLLFVLLITGQCMAQQKEKNNGPATSPSYAIKWNPESLYFGKIGLSGEYNFKHKKSVTFGVGIPFNQTLSYRLDGKDRSFSMKTFSIMAGYRMYTGRKYMKGIYFEPYLKYLKNDASTIINENLNGSPVDLLTTSNYSGFGVGLQLGAQFIIAKKIVLDFFFLGPEANSVNHKAAMHDITSTGSWDAQDAADAQKAINDNIGDIPIIGKKLKVTVDANSRTVSSEYKGFMPGFRAGLSIGIRF